MRAEHRQQLLVISTEALFSNPRPAAPRTFLVDQLLRTPPHARHQSVQTSSSPHARHQSIQTSSSPHARHQSTTKPRRDSGAQGQWWHSGGEREHVEGGSGHMRAPSVKGEVREGRCEGRGESHPSEHTAPPRPPPTSTGQPAHVAVLTVTLTPTPTPTSTPTPTPTLTPTQAPTSTSPSTLPSSSRMGASSSD